MGNKQQIGEGGHETLEEPSPQPSHEPRKSRHLSMESVSAEISLDGNFISTGQTSVDESGRPTLNGHKHRRLTSTQFLGVQGDKAVAASPQKRPTNAKHQRSSTIPQQVLKFEKQMETTGNQFEQYHEQLKCLLERESPSNRNLKLTSSGNVRLPAPVGRHELARTQLVHGANYFPVHAPKYHDVCSAEEKQNLQVLKINKEGLTLYAGSHWEVFDYGGDFTRMDEKRLHKKLGAEITSWNLRTIAQWRVFEHHFSFRYIDPSKQTDKDQGVSSYTVESAEPASIGKTIEAYVAVLMDDLGMDSAGTFTPHVENFAGGKVRGDNATHMSRKSMGGPGSLPAPHRRRSSFMVDSPLRKASTTSQRSLVSPPVRFKAMSPSLSEDYGITLIAGKIGRRAGGFMGFNKKFQKKFYAVYRTSQGHYLAEYQNENCACLPQNPRAKWKWPKAWIDLSTTLRVYSPSIVDTKAGDLSLDIITPEKIWTFQFDNEEELGKWVRRISTGIQKDALIVPDRWEECYGYVYHRFAERTNYGDRKTKKIGEAKIILKILSMDFQFTSKKNPNLSFMYWEIMSWRSFRSEASGKQKMALRCFKDGAVHEYEMETFQPELLEIMEAKLTMYTTKLAAGISALRQSSAEEERGPPSNRNKKKGPPSKGQPPQRKGGPPPKKKGGPVKSSHPPNKGKPAQRKGGLPPKKKGGPVKTSQQQMLHAATGGSGKKFVPKSRGKSKGTGGPVRGKGARRRPSMGVVQ